jgi:thiol:disulfide interchange protein DsbD
MEDLVWTKPEINDLIRNEYVLVSLYVDDQKPLDKVLRGPDGRRIRNVGNKWALFEEVNFKKQSQPYYALINTKEEVLNQPKAYTPDVAEYKAFLECGIEQYKKSMTE